MKLLSCVDTPSVPTPSAPDSSAVSSASCSLTCYAELGALSADSVEQDVSRCHHSTRQRTWASIASQSIDRVPLQHVQQHLPAAANPAAHHEPFSPAPSTAADPVAAKLTHDTLLVTLREEWWSLVDSTAEAEDHKLATKCPAWREAIETKTGEILDATGSLEASTNLIRSKYPDRAQRNVNPAQVAAVLQPAVDEGRLSREEADHVIRVAKSGVSCEEFRELAGPSLDLRTGKPPDAADEEVLKDFYFDQAGWGRILPFPERYNQILDADGAVILSPSFVVRAPGKKPRAVLHLSSTAFGVNQRMDEKSELAACAEGYTTIPKIARICVQAFVDMVLLPGKYSITDTAGIELVMIAMDGDAAFFRQPVHAKMVGVQSTRIGNVTFIPMCCTFGWARSAESFSYVTKAIIAAHQSDIDSATLIKAGFDTPDVSSLSQLLQDFVNDRSPDSSGFSVGHVDDFFGCELASGLRPAACAADLAWAVKAMLGHDGLSLKKFDASSFWSDFQKVIGAWFDSQSFTVTMPRDKIIAALDMLNSDLFHPSVTDFQLSACASLHGKMRWAGFCTPLGECNFLINIERQRIEGESGNRRVKAWRHSGETPECALVKGHNDLLIRKLFLEACLANPNVASCSMVSLMTFEDRLLVPGQSQWLFWLSGDFSLQGQSMTWEITYPVAIKQYSFIAHPESVIELLRLALAGKADKNGLVIMSSVLERQNKLMAQAQARKLIAGRPGIVLDDNTGSVAALNKAYSKNFAIQAMELASSLQQAVDESPLQSYWTCTENMGICDWISRREYVLFDAMQTELKLTGDEWTYVAPCHDVCAISQWLPRALDSDLPLVKDLVGSLSGLSAKPFMPTRTLFAHEIQSPPDLAWQDRVRAAVSPIPHYMGSFGPMAYSTSHLVNPVELGHCPASYSSLRQANASTELSHDCYRVWDNFHGGCGLTMGAIAAGLHVAGGCELHPEEIAIFEDLTYQSSAGDVNFVDFTRIAPVHILATCSDCMDFSPLGRKGGHHGPTGNQFSKQFGPAQACGALVVVYENVEGVVRMHGGAAMAQLEEAAINAGFGTHHYHQAVRFSEHGEPENRVRRIGVAFHDSVALAQTFMFPEQLAKRRCAGEFLEPSFNIPADLWDDRPWTRIVIRRDAKGTSILTLGFVSLADKVGSPSLPSRVWHPLGLSPTILASGNAQLVLVPMLRAMCPLFAALMAWASPIFSRTGSLVQKFLLRKRRLLPSEKLALRGFPVDYPKANDTVINRCAGNAVPPAYFARLFAKISYALYHAGVQTKLPLKPHAYQSSLRHLMRVESSVQHPVFQQLGCSVACGIPYTLSGDACCDSRPNRPRGLLGQRIGEASHPGPPRKGYSLFRNRNRESLSSVPVGQDELDCMELKRKQFGLSGYADGSIVNMNLGVRHWANFCSRFNKPRYLKAVSVAEIQAATAQAELFLLYEAATFGIKASSVCAKLAAVSKDHLNRRLNDPFADNAVLHELLADARKSDAPEVPKCPVTEALLNSIDSMLDLSSMPAFVLRTGCRAALMFLMRLSEWAFGDKHTITFRSLTFFDKDRIAIDLVSVDQMDSIHELECVFMSSKTTRWGDGLARSIFAMTDRTDSRCVVRDIALLWILSERDLDHPVFSWDKGQKGPSRAAVAKILKSAAVNIGIPAASISSHSLRIGGLCLLMAHGLDYERAKQFGRWKSDCIRKYWWAATSLVEGFQDVVWDVVRFTRVRGGGAVQRI